jgi:DNA-binding LacI/PurR family transcriptional regulator
MDIRTFSSLIGVSTATVSRAFSGRGVVGAATKEHVLSEARRLNFSPNVLAQRLSMQSSGVLGLYYSFGDEAIFDYYNMELAQEVAKAAAAAGFGLHLELAPRRTPVPTDPAAQLAALAAGKAIDGVVVVSDGHESARHLLTQLKGTPAVILTGELHAGLDCLAQVVIDFEPGVRAAVDHLVAHGHRNIGFVRGLGDTAKLSSLQKALAAHGLKPADVAIRTGHKTFADGQRAFAELRAAGVTAAICATDILALGAIHGASAAGVKLPQEFSIIGIDDLAIAEHSVPTLSSIGVPRAILAREAIAALTTALRKPADDETAPTVQPASTYFIPRESSGPLSA